MMTSGHFLTHTVMSSIFSRGSADGQSENNGFSFSPVLVIWNSNNVYVSTTVAPGAKRV